MLKQAFLFVPRHLPCCFLNNLIKHYLPLSTKLLRRVFVDYSLHKPSAAGSRVPSSERHHSIWLQEVNSLLTMYSFTWILLWITVMFLPSVVASEASTGEDPLVNTGTGGEEEGEGHNIPPAHAVLFPAFCLTLGVAVFYFLSRYLQALPYTAVMFLIGTLMGIGAALSHDDNQLSESIQLWVEIDSEVLLLVFLPGLIFKDAIGLNVHLFRVALGQCFNFAFPMVLAGTALTALVAFYVFPYGWSFNLAMTVSPAHSL